MKLPESNSRSEKILMAFLNRGALTIYQGEEIHGNFGSSRYSEEANHARLVAAYALLVEQGYLVRDGIKYRLSVRAEDALRRKFEPRPAGEVVPPRERRSFAEPLRAFFRNAPFHYAL